MAMTGLDPTQTIAENYRRFGEFEAAGRSPTYEQLSYDVAADPAVLGFLAGLPAGKQQPNLLYAAARVLLGAVPDIAGLRRLVAGGGAELRALMRSRRTQTNEAGRCSLPLPALSRLPQPLALVEVGASAGLTLLPDIWSYDYALPDGSHHRVAGRDGDAPVLECRVTGGVPPLPDQVPDVAWRAGLDLNPLDLSDADDVAWLHALVWPDQPHRAERLARAIEVARRDPPRVVAGDLLDDLHALVSQAHAAAPASATIVVFHSAVLAYVDVVRRRRFAELIAELGVVWLSNEGQHFIPPPFGVEPRDVDAFLLLRDGREALAFADGHATWLDWLPAGES